MSIDLAVVGSINADITATTRRLPAAGETVGGGRLLHSPGGKGANQATAAARLGARTRMIGAVGRDASGEAMLRALDRAGVDRSDVAEVDVETGTALIMVDAAGENQIAVCEGANAHVSLDGIDFGADEAVLTQLEISLDLISELARRVPGYLVINAAPAIELPAEVVQRADLIIVNETEYSLLPQLREAKCVAVTYGSRGSALLERGQQIAFAEALPRTPVSTVGAGDAFCAALTIALRSGLSPERSLRAANAVGAAAVMDAAAQPHFDTLETILAGLDSSGLD
ncbi:MAG: ribokinase [Brevibacterium sp.]